MYIYIYIYIHTAIMELGPKKTSLMMVFGIYFHNGSLLWSLIP